MSRSVSVPHDAVAVAYLYHDAEPAPEPSDDEDADDIGVDCEQDAQDWYEEVRDTLQRDACVWYPSMSPKMHWRGREDLTVAYNELGVVGLSQYGGVISVWAAPLDPDGEFTLAANWLQQIGRKWFVRVESMGLGVPYQCTGFMSNGEAVYRRVGADA